MDIRHIFLPALLLCLLTAAPAGASAPDPARIAAMLGSQDRAENALGLAALKTCGQSALPGLIRAADDPAAPVRRGAVMGLILQPAPALAQDALLRAMRDPDFTVRYLAAHALARIGSPAASDVAALLGDPDDTVCAAAILSLRSMGPASIPALTRLLERDNPVLQAKAAWILADLGPRAMPAVPALIRALKTGDIRLVHVLAEVLDMIGPDPATVCHEMLLIGTDRTNQPFARLGAQAAPALVNLLARPGTPMAQIALYALARMGDQAEPALRAVLATGTEGQRAVAALLLTGIDPDLARSLPEDLRRSLGGALPHN